MMIAGSSPWGSTERLQALANLLCISGGEPALLDALQPAVHGWVTLGASGGMHDSDTQQRHLILGMSPIVLPPILRALRLCIRLAITRLQIPVKSAMSAHSSI